MRAAGFEKPLLRGHSFVEAPRAGTYLLAFIDRGARRRSDAGEFHGHIGYVSAVARRP
jgi:hypothetical protein